MERKKNKQQKLHIKRGDTVKVIAGNSKGKDGKVLEVLAEKHRKPSATNPEGSVDKVEAAIHISNLMLVDPATGEATRTGRKADEKGKLQRYSKKTGEVIKND
jgi:large subunit ribosomal protein L24